MASSEQTLAYPPEDLAKLGPGSELDKLVHTMVFKLPVDGKKRIPNYSGDARLIIPAFGHLPLGMGRSQYGDTFYSDDRPYWAGHAGYDAIFVASSLSIAACKAAVYIAQLVDKNKPTPDAAE